MTIRSIVALVLVVCWSGCEGHVGDPFAITSDHRGCGDGVCRGHETCSSCPQDCGTCTAPDAGVVIDASVAACPLSLQGAIDAAPTGSTLDVSGCTFSAPATITRALTIVGGTVTVGSTQMALTIKASGVTIDGMTLLGPVAPTDVNFASEGVWIEGTSTTPVANTTIKNCTIQKFAGAGIEARHVTNLIVDKCVIEDAGYAGIGVYSGVGGRLTTNTVRRVGYVRNDLTLGCCLNNAYGITLDRNHTGNLTTDPQSTSFLIDGNIIEDVPLWMGLNVHAATHTTFSNNTVRRCPRAIFIAGDGDVPNHLPADITIAGNRLEQCVTKAGGTTNQVGILTASLQGGSITNNMISSTFESSIDDYGNASVNVTISGNTTIP